MRAVLHYLPIEWMVGEKIRETSERLNQFDQLTLGHCVHGVSPFL